MKDKYIEYIKYECFSDVGVIKGLVRAFFVNGMYNAIMYIRLYQMLTEKNSFLAIHFKNLLVKKYGIFIGKKTKIGKGLILPHPSSIVFGQDVVIGENALIFQNVTIGSKIVGGRTAFYPQIGDNRILCCGSCVLANEKELQVGNNSVIGANSILFESVGDNSICVGSPAKVVKQK